MVQEEEVPPSIDLLESMRSVGYSLEAAVADLIDNSISAGAHNVDIDLEPTRGAHIAIIDDGIGMAPETAIEALRFAGSVRTREGSDLGRFGLGLKTASLSQARSLTVITKAGQSITGLRWDIDRVRESGKWSLLRLDPQDWEGLFWASRLENQSSGTLVVWENLDLLLGDAKEPGSYIQQRTLPLAESIALTFHRYLERNQNSIHIKVNGNQVKPVDPFLTSNKQTQTSPTQHLKIGGAKVGVTAYTLPHLSGLSPEELKRPDLGSKMRESQGFYIYRNKRLISHGHWYGLAKMDEITKQTRIQVDIPNTIDDLWQLDIKKSRAEPPASFKNELRRVMSGVINKGKRIYTFRGRKENLSNVIHLWEKLRDRDGVRYEINSNHPLVLAAFGELSTSQSQNILRLFSSIAKSFPTDDLYAEMAGNQRVISKSGSEDEIEEQLRQIKKSGLLNVNGQVMQPDSIAKVLSHTEPFNSFKNLSQTIEKIWKEDPLNVN